MAEEYVLALKVFLAAWFVTNFDPIIYVVSELEDALQEKYTKILYPIQCFKCLTLWSVFAFTQDIFLALAFSLLASIYDRN